jgi:hypothetical protein
MQAAAIAETSGSVRHRVTPAFIIAMRKKKNPKNRAFDANRAVEMYRAGKRIQAIALEFGYAPGTGSNTVRYALEKAGVFRLSRPHVHELTGQRFTRLLVIERAGSNKHGFSLWKCICDCGNQRIVAAGELLRGDTKSCGCLRKERIARLKWKHGHARLGQWSSPTYQSWLAMQTRCTNPSATNWKDYGGRGIRICERWQGEHGFENFFGDMGHRQLGKTLDRILVNGHYEPGNCKWSTRVEQRNNQRTVDPFIAGESQEPIF